MEAVILPVQSDFDGINEQTVDQECRKALNAARDALMFSDWEPH